MTKEEDLIIAEQNKSRDEILKAIEKVKCELLGIIQGKDKAMAELEKKISILLSCKNCPENKGGYICEKEYENKCLSQKIQFIKELQQENVELKKEVDLWKKASENNSYKAFQFEKENAELKAKNKWYSEQVCNKECAEVWGNLTKAKVIIKKFLEARSIEETCVAESEAEQFLSEVEK